MGGEGALVDAAEDRVRRVVEASPMALVMVDRLGRIALVNERAEHMFGYARDEMLNQQLENLLPERYLGGHVKLRDAFHLESSTRQMGAGRELFGRRKDGSEFPLEIGLNPLTLDNMPMVLAGIVDVTARLAAEREREQRQRDLERTNADLEEFAYITSHDLKAPLRALGHLAEWISEDVAATAGPETLENLALMKGRVARMQMLLDGLLTYARVGRDKMPPEDVDAGELVHDIATLLGPPSGFTVVFEGPERRLHTQRTPLRVVLENLISNALKHHDRSQGHIRVGLRRLKKMVEFTVADDGPGIALRFHTRIFQIFQTLSSRDEKEASGIGLAIVKKQVGSHGGTVRVESDPPARGTTFIFTWRDMPL
jgi:PAS domain S-box-containing protein